MKDRYDIAVIGAGIGGLAAGALLAHKGLSVAVFEAGRTPGGYCTSFKRGGYTFDSVLDAISGCGPKGWLTRTLDQHLGVASEVEFVKLDPLRVDMFGGDRVAIPGGLPGMMDLLYDTAPSERESILKLMEAMEDVYRTAMATMPETFYTDPRMERRGGPIAKYRRASFKDLLDDYIKDHKVRAILSDRCAFMGLPPSGVSALQMVIMFMTYAQGGGYRIKDGAQNLSDAFVSGLTKFGGDMFTGSPVRSIRVEGGKVSGIETGDGFAGAGAVISAIDAASTAALANIPVEPAGQRPSVSYFMVYLGLDKKLDIPDSMGIYPGYDIESTFADIATDIASPNSSLELINYSGISPSMAPRDCMTLMLMAKAAYNYAKDWRVCKEREMERIIDKADAAVPGIRGSIAHAGSATPLTLERYTGNSGGAAFGWEQIPGNPRTPVSTPVAGLYNAGHWTYPGGGIESVTATGIVAAELAARYVRG